MELPDVGLKRRNNMEKNIDIKENVERRVAR